MDHREILGKLTPEGKVSLLSGRDFWSTRPLEEYGIEQMLFSRAEYDRKYSESYYLVTGHTPTFQMGKEYDGKLYRKNHHIAIDCGCVSGRRLGVYCFDTGECFYSSDY